MAENPRQRVKEAFSPQLFFSVIARSPRRSNLAKRCGWYSQAGSPRPVSFFSTSRLLDFSTSRLLDFSTSRLLSSIRLLHRFYFYAPNAVLFYTLLFLRQKRGFSRFAKSVWPCPNKKIKILSNPQPPLQPLLTTLYPRKTRFKNLTFSKYVSSLYIDRLNALIPGGTASRLCEARRNGLCPR